MGDRVLLEVSDLRVVLSRIRVKTIQALAAPQTGILLVKLFRHIKLKKLAAVNKLAI